VVAPWDRVSWGWRWSVPAQARRDGGPEIACTFCGAGSSPQHAPPQVNVSRYTAGTGRVAWAPVAPAQQRRRGSAALGGTGYYGHVAISAGIVRGGALLDPVLEVELKVQADGLAPGVAAMILTSCHVQGARLPADLGRAATGPSRNGPGA
jgi:hypothetical protein